MACYSIERKDQNYMDFCLLIEISAILYVKI